MGKRARCNPSDAVEKRKQARLNIGSLTPNLISPQAQRRYHAAVFGFVSALVAFGIYPGESWEALDAQVCWYLECLWMNGDNKTIARDVISGVTWLLRSKRQLPYAWRLFSTWGKLEKPRQAPPMSCVMLLAFVGLCIEDGNLDVAALAYTAFHCILRTGEMLRLAPWLIYVASSGHGVVTVVVDSKTMKHQQGRGYEHITIDDPHCGKLLGLARINWSVHSPENPFAVPCRFRKHNGAPAAWTSSTHALQLKKRWC